MLLKLWQYLRRDKLIHPLPTDFVTPYDAAELDWNTLLVMMTGKARDVAAVERLMAKYNVTSAQELVPLLPKRQKPSLKERFLLFLQRAEGSLPIDPVQHEINLMRKKLPERRGQSETQISYIYKKGSK